MSEREPSNAELLAAVNAVRTDLLGGMTTLESGLRGEIAASRAETSRLLDGVQTSLDGIREDLTVIGAANDRTRKAGENTRDEVREVANSLPNIERILLKHGTRLDDLEKRIPKP